MPLSAPGPAQALRKAGTSLNGTPETRKPYSHADGSVQRGARSAAPGPAPLQQGGPSVTGEAGREERSARCKQTACGSRGHVLRCSLAG